MKILKANQVSFFYLLETKLSSNILGDLYLSRKVRFYDKEGMNNNFDTFLGSRILLK